MPKLLWLGVGMVHHSLLFCSVAFCINYLPFHVIFFFLASLWNMIPALLFIFFFPDLTKSLVSQIFIIMISISTNYFCLYCILQSASFLLSFPLFLHFPHGPSFFPSLPCMTPFLFWLGSVGNSKAASHTLGTPASLSLLSDYEQKTVVQQVYCSSFCGFHHTNYYTLMYSLSYLFVSCYYLYFTNGELS